VLLLLSCCRLASERHNRKCVCRASECDSIASLERKNVSGFLWGRDRVTELLQNAPDFRHLLRARNCKLSTADEKRVFQPHSYVSAHRRRVRCERHLETAGGQDGPSVVVSEQPVGGLLHEHEVLGLGADAAEDAEYRLHEEWRPNELFVDEVSQIVEVSDIVAFVLEARTVLLAERFEDAFNIAKRVAEDEIVAPAQVWLLPVMLPRGVAIRERKCRSSSFPC
jgi:hypothetical protein